MIDWKATKSLFGYGEEAVWCDKIVAVCDYCKSSYIILLSSYRRAVKRCGCYRCAACYYKKSMGWANTNEIKKSLKNKTYKRNLPLNHMLGTRVIAAATRGQHFKPVKSSDITSQTYGKPNTLSSVKSLIDGISHRPLSSVPSVGYRDPTQSQKNIKFLASALTFVKKAHKIYNHKYTYSLTNYHDPHNKILIICPEHGPFYQTPHDHLNGHACPKCE